MQGPSSAQTSTGTDAADSDSTVWAISVTSSGGSIATKAQPPRYCDSSRRISARIISRPRTSRSVGPPMPIAIGL